MPTQANQAPAPGQEAPLPVERVQSTIPKGGTESTWLYPSPQMVFILTLIFTLCLLFYSLIFSS
jgi:hypothetical protein